MTGFQFDPKKYSKLSKIFNLPERETKVYTGLLSLGSGTLGQISLASGLDIISTAEVLKSLEQQGFIKKIAGPVSRFIVMEPWLQSFVLMFDTSSLVSLQQAFTKQVEMETSNVNDRFEHAKKFVEDTIAQVQKEFGDSLQNLSDVFMSVKGTVDFTYTDLETVKNEMLQLNETLATGLEKVRTEIQASIQKSTVAVNMKLSEVTTQLLNTIKQENQSYLDSTEEKFINQDELLVKSISHFSDGLVSYLTEAQKDISNRASQLEELILNLQKEHKKAVSHIISQRKEFQSTYKDSFVQKHEEASNNLNITGTKVKELNERLLKEFQAKISDYRKNLEEFNAFINEKRSVFDRLHTKAENFILETTGWVSSNVKLLLASFEPVKLEIDRLVRVVEQNQSVLKFMSESTMRVLDARQDLKTLRKWLEDQPRKRGIQKIDDAYSLFDKIDKGLGDLSMDFTGRQQRSVDMLKENEGTIEEVKGVLVDKSSTVVQEIETRFNQFLASLSESTNQIRSEFDQDLTKSVENTLKERKEAIGQLEQKYLEEHKNILEYLDQGILAQRENLVTFKDNHLKSLNQIEESIHQEFDTEVNQFAEKTTDMENLHKDYYDVVNETLNSQREKPGEIIQSYIDTIEDVRKQRLKMTQEHVEKNREVVFEHFEDGIAQYNAYVNAWGEAIQKIIDKTLENQINKVETNPQKFDQNYNEKKNMVAAQLELLEESFNTMFREHTQVSQNFTGKVVEASQTSLDRVKKSAIEGIFDNINAEFSNAVSGAIFKMKETNTTLRDVWEMARAYEIPENTVQTDVLVGESAVVMMMKDMIQRAQRSLMIVMPKPDLQSLILVSRLPARIRVDVVGDFRSAPQKILRKVLEANVRLRQNDNPEFWVTMVDQAELLIAPGVGEDEDEESFSGMVTSATKMVTLFSGAIRNLTIRAREVSLSSLGT
ncbi:MAG: helix-turn-helix domain-containing protein [Candidatus Hermodarchaeota archaeon]